MTRKDVPDDANRPPLPKGYVYDRDGKPLSPLDQLANVIDAVFFDSPDSNKDFKEYWNSLPQAERDTHISRAKRAAQAAIKEAMSLTSESPSQDSGAPGKRNWAKDTGRTQTEPGKKQRE